MIGRRAGRIAGITVLVTTALAGTGVVMADAAVKWESVSSADSLTGDCATGYRSRLGTGSKGDAVESAQCLLNRQGSYRLAENGNYDARTRAAVSDFQSKHGLARDGVVGDSTWRALERPALGVIKQPKPKVSSERRKTLSRAKTWLTAKDGRPVPYSQAAFYKGYRTDCSGYASMALSLGASPVTTGLAEPRYTRKIAMKDLQPGDLVLRSTGPWGGQHVVIFEKWTSRAKTSYIAYEQTGDGMRTRHRKLTYGLVKGDLYDGRRPTKYDD